jgi:hypothetical protein
MRKSRPSTALFDQLIKVSGEPLQEGDNVFLISDELLPLFYEMYEITHGEMLKFPGLKILIKNHIIQSVKGDKLEMVSGQILPYVLNKSVDGISIGDIFTQNGIKFLLLEGVLLPNESELIQYVKDLRNPDKPKISPTYTRRKVETIQLKDYSEKAVVLVGDTKKYKEGLAKNKLFIWNPNLKGGAGWIASKKSLDRVRSSLQKLDMPYEDLVE